MKFLPHFKTTYQQRYVNPHCIINLYTVINFSNLSFYSTVLIHLSGHIGQGFSVNMSG